LHDGETRKREELIRFLARQGEHRREKKGTPRSVGKKGEEEAASLDSWKGGKG